MRRFRLKFMVTLGVFASVTLGFATDMLRAQAMRTGKSDWVNPHHALNEKAYSVKPGDEQSIRALTDELFNFPRAFPRMPSPVEAVLKHRLVQAEIKYRQGTAPGVREGDIVAFVNHLADKLQAPAFAKTNLRQVRVLRMSLVLASPAFMGDGITRQNMHVGDSINDTMSPLQAFHLISSMFDQKLLNVEFQTTPEEWDQNHYSGSVQKLQEAQRFQQSGQPATRHVKLQHNSSFRDLHDAVYKGIGSLSFSDSLNLIDDALSTLKIAQ